LKLWAPDREDTSPPDPNCPGIGSGADERDGAGDEAAEQNEIGRCVAVEEVLDGLGGEHVREPFGGSLRGRQIDVDSVQIVPYLNGVKIIFTTLG